jgi:3-deoxy-D-manno-octulosonate 8-phosphate phosphatase (KDO 8-P phosphatase)
MSEVAALPDKSESGSGIRLVVFDFDGVFTDNTVWCDESGGEWVRCWRSDGLGLEKLRQLAIPTWVLSTEAHPTVAKRCAKLRVPCRHGLSDKAAELVKLAGETGIDPRDMVYVGNDINDAGCLRLVGTPIVVQDAHPDVLPAARYRTRRPGGFGAVREVCDWISASVISAREGFRDDRV